MSRHSHSGSRTRRSALPRPPGVSPPHSCSHCRAFTIYLFDKPAAEPGDRPTWFQPNASQDALAARLFGQHPPPDLDDWDDRRGEFYRVTNGISFFDASLHELDAASRDGCALCRRIARCLPHADDRPESFAIGAKVLTEYSVAWGILDLDALRWEDLLGVDTEVVDDNVFSLLAFPGARSNLLGGAGAGRL